MSIPTASVRIIKSGLFSTLQDKGRFGLRHLGIPWAGTLCPAWQEIANAMVGNDVDEPVIECFEGGLQMQALDHDVLVSVVGSHTAKVETGIDTHWHSAGTNSALTLRAGESLRVSSTGETRHLLIAIAGLSIPTHLGSTSTYAKATLGGLDGTNLQAGQTLSVRQQTPSTQSPPFVELQCELPEDLRYQSRNLRIIAGPQMDHFSVSGISTFLEADYQMGVEADRMGVRLIGPKIEHKDNSAKDIVSDAIMPGSIQVPGTGLPIVLLNDAHTAGGYPKIATVISSDLPLLGLQRSGATFNFKLIDIDEAIAINADYRKLIDTTISSLTPRLRSKLDTETLLQTNLIDGVTDGI